MTDTSQTTKVIEVLDENGKISLRLSQLNGLNHGPMEIYKDGQLIQKILFSMGVKEGLSTVYDSHGDIQAEFMYSQDKLNGESRMYNNGNVMSLMNYQNNELQGEVINCDAAGNRVFKAHYKQGKLDGEMIAYFDTGEPSRVSEYKGNRLHGFVTTFYPNGVRQEQKYYENDKLEGRAITFNQSGDVRQVAHYKEGLLLGPPSEFDDDGKILKAS